MIRPVRGTGRTRAVRAILADRRVAYVIVGGLNTLLGTAWFVAFQLLFQALDVGRFDYMAALVCAQAASIMTSFLAQRYFVFKVRGHFWADLARFATVSMTAFGVNLALLPICVELLGWPKIPAQLAVTAIIAVATYIAHRDFSFRRPGTAPSPGDDVRTDTGRTDTEALS
ncbi:GtrA family protein [Sanguibacter hominis ATCC BAA-789]|uniref:GtrA family protein n=1 Tax=Sanguibacter hominis ATCC BAA-789 TaxID=1312740 RepID=A0A9X5FCD1_9MICO|nr:GtrA family protein [Sanguibacter hominis ATCC BAA-789]